MGSSWSGPRGSGTPGQSHLVSCPRQPLGDSSNSNQALVKGCAGAIKRGNGFCVRRAGKGRPLPSASGWGAHSPSPLSQRCDRAVQPGSALLHPGTGAPDAACPPGQRSIPEGPCWEGVSVDTGRVKSVRNSVTVSLGSVNADRWNRK